MVSQGGMGLSAITWSELYAFNICNGLELNGWEFSQLMSMSRAYCKWNSIGSNQTDIADDVPWFDRRLSPSAHLSRQREASLKEQNESQL